MDLFSYELLQLLKKQYLHTIGENRFMIQGEGIDHPARQFYLYQFEDNIIRPISKNNMKIYDLRFPKDLVDKMRALRSSVALTYNLLDNQQVKFEANKFNITGGEYEVMLEAKLTTLRKREGKSPAHLDAILINKEAKEMVACEVKMTEWLFNKPSTLRSAYLQQANYDYTDVATPFIQVANKLIAPSSDFDDMVIGADKIEKDPFLKQYDGLQMFKHTLACYNYCNENRNLVKKLSLLNVIWELPNNWEGLELSEETKCKYRLRLENQHREFDCFLKLMEPIHTLFSSIGVEFQLKYVTAKEFANCLYKTQEEKDYLKRYFL